MYYNDEWGTVCGDGWDFNDAEVVCRQLGYGPPIVTRHRAYYEQGIGQIWLGNLNCSGNESSIGECSHAGWGIHNCTHYEDAGVECYPANGNSNVYFCTSYLSVYISMYEVVQFTCTISVTISSCKWTHMV